MRQAVIAQPQHHADTRFVLSELAWLALEIATVERCDLATATARAMRQLDELMTAAEQHTRFVPTGDAYGYH